MVAPVILDILVIGLKMFVEQSAQVLEPGVRRGAR
jgi:hypothetical protein